MLSSRIYKPEDLCKILFEANQKQTPFELIHEENFHVKYLRDYLGEDGLKAKFFLEEREYISADYLTDYSYYYSQSFHDYENKCVRLHFFQYDDDQVTFDKELEQAILEGNDYRNLAINTFWEKNYLGFIVIRPIPKFMIGYTLLRTYNYRPDAPNFDKDRNYWGIKDYDIHVFGCHVKLQSLAFQSQDSNVAACATIAVWSMLQRAAENYYINLKSPYEITQDAGLTSHDGNRVFPNSGLDIVSIANAITKCKLATEIVDLEDKKHKIDYIQKYVNAYSKLKLPIILGLSVPIKNKHERHAVAICGHHNNYQLIEKTGYWRKIMQLLSHTAHFKPKFRYNSVDKIYMHDDQWGPFSRGEFPKREKMLTSWTKHTDETHLSEPIAMVIPVFPQIRIAFPDIEDHTIALNQLFNDATPPDEPSLDLTWDIQLHFSAEFKDEVRETGLFHVEIAEEKDVFMEFMKVPLPKYIWVSTLYIKNFKTIYFVYDATGLRHTSSLLFALCYYPLVQEKFSNLLNKFKRKSLVSQKSELVLEKLLMDSIDGFIQNLLDLILIKSKFLILSQYAIIL